MTRRTATLLGLLLLVLAACLGLFLYKHIEPYQQIIDHGPAPEARSNPYLAAEHFLRGRGLNVTHASSLGVLSRLETRQESLLLLGPRGNLSARQVDDLLQWVTTGGRLLVAAEKNWDPDSGQSGDPLLDRLGVQLWLSKDLKDDPAQVPDEPFPNLTKLYLEHEPTPAYFGFIPELHLEDPDNQARAWANSAGATHLMQLDHGLGTITVVSDANLWKNPTIAQYDNAWLLWYLTQDSNVTLVFNTAHDNLLSQLWRYFPQALLALLALVGLWLWHIGLRQGPLQAPTPLARRQLLEHLRASADFLLRRSGQTTLLHNLQQDIQRRARLRYPGFERLPVAEQWQVLSRLTRQPTSAISQALRPRPKERLSSADFCRQVAHLQTLRNAL